MADVDIYINTQISGRLSKTGEKHFLGYHQDTDEALSLTMPLRVESYAYPELHPRFQMNMPEGHLRHAIERATAKQYGNDDLTLLTLLGSDQIGHLGYALAGKALAKQDSDFPDLNTLLNSEDATLFNQLLTRFATRSGVSGIQPKVLLDTVESNTSSLESKISLPLRSYIVKSWRDEYPELGCNETVCLNLARHAGLQVPTFYLSENGKLLISKRFDLTDAGERLGFEDFCVLQGKGTREKYDASLESCANTIQQYVSPIYQQQALADLFKLTLVNVLVRNGDAHLKNIGVLYRHLKNFQLGKLPETKRTLSPIFDIVSTTPYIPNDTMALTLTGSKRWPKWKVLKKFGQQHCGLDNRKIDQTVDEVLRASADTLPLLNELSKKHLGFTDIAEQMEVLLGRGFE